MLEESSGRVFVDADNGLYYGGGRDEEDEEFLNVSPMGPFVNEKETMYGLTASVKHRRDKLYCVSTAIVSRKKYHLADDTFNLLKDHCDSAEV